MLLIIQKMNDLPFAQLMEVYEETNRKTGQQYWPAEPEARQIALAEESFYSYLKDGVFRTPEAIYALWQEQGSIVSALRLEPFEDGLLLTALETAPDVRGKGYATKLIHQVLSRYPGQNFYVHIRRNNTASKAVHLRCGFRLLRTGAKLLDGSYRANYDTYIHKTSINP